MKLEYVQHRMLKQFDIVCNPKLSWVDFVEFLLKQRCRAESRATSQDVWLQLRYTD